MIGFVILPATAQLIAAFIGIVGVGMVFPLAARSLFNFIKGVLPR